jgi:hypothetical protein
MVKNMEDFKMDVQTTLCMVILFIGLVHYKLTGTFKLQNTIMWSTLHFTLKITAVITEVGDCDTALAS